MLTSICVADEDERYAHPDGEDEYGQRYAAREVPSEMKEALDELGRYTLPSFINLTIMHDGLECWVIGQDPPAGTVLTGVQIAVVELIYTCDGQTEYGARLPIELIDVTPPEIAVELLSNVTPQVSFGGVLRYVLPNAVVPMITVYDGADANPAKEYILDGQPYQIGTPITGFGIHILNLSAKDASDNETRLPMMFEIRERPSITAAAVVQSTECEFSPDGLTGLMRATILISSADFDHRSIYLSSVRALLRGPGGSFYNLAPIPIRGGFTPICDKFQSHLAAVLIDNCVISIEIESPFYPEIPNECPESIDIIGVTLSNGSIGLEWGARAANVADPNAEQTLLNHVMKQPPCGPPGGGGDPPPPPCQPIQTVIQGVTCRCIDPLNGPPWWNTASGTGTGCSATSGSSSTALASGNFISGNSLSRVTANVLGVCSTSTQCDAAKNSGLIVQLVGNCCNCAITFSASAEILAEASVQGSGNFYMGDAKATGRITLAAPCDYESALATVAVFLNSEDAPPSSTPNPASSLGFADINCTDYACASFIAVSLSAEVTTFATASANLSVWKANCTSNSFVGGSANYSATTNFTVCPPDSCDP